MITKALLFASFVAVVLLGFWTKNLRLENDHLKSEVRTLTLAAQTLPECPSPSAAPAVTPPPSMPTPMPQASHKPKAKSGRNPYLAQIKKLKARLKALNTQGREIDQRSKAYLQKENGGRNSEIQQTRTALTVVTESIQEARDENNRTELKELFARRKQLRLELKSLTGTSKDLREKVAAEVAAEKSELQTERAQIQHRLKVLEAATHSHTP